MISSPKIFCLLAAVSKGGMERQLIVLMEQLLKHHYDVTLITFSPRKDMYAYSDKIHRVRLASHVGNQFCTFLNIRKYFKKCISKDDVIISFGTEINVIALLASFGLKRHLIVGERNFTIGENKWDKMSHWLYRKADAIVPNSYSQMRYLQKKLPKLSEKIVVITNYTDYNIFRPMPQLLNREDIKVIGIFARILHQKNTIGFVRAIKMVIDAGYKNFKVEWYGEKASMDNAIDDYLNRVIALIDELGVNEYIEIHPSITNVVEKINYCDAFCLPSFREGFSNAISEAICCGKIVLASDVSDNSIMVHEGKNGFLFDPNNVKDMADAIIRYLSLNKEEIVAMSEYSRQLSLKLFNLNQFTDMYVKIIKKVVQ